MTGSIVRISRLLMIAASLICAMAASAPAEDSSPDLATLATWPHLTDDWFGVRKSLADRGITFDISFSVDATKNVRGGLDTAGSAWRTLFDPSVELDLKPLIGLEGGTAYGEFQWA
jgi:porin